MIGAMVLYLLVGAGTGIAISELLSRKIPEMQEGANAFIAIKSALCWWLVLPVVAILGTEELVESYRKEIK